MGRIYEDIEPDITIYWDEDHKQWAAYAEEIPEHKAVGATRKEAFEGLLNFLEWKAEEEKATRKEIRREALMIAASQALSTYGANSLTDYLRIKRAGEFFANRRPSKEDVCDWLAHLSAKS